MDSTGTLEQIQARHRKEAKELQGRITNKKKNATKKTRKGINDECAELERSMKERQAEEIRRLTQGQGEDKEEEEGAAVTGPSAAAVAEEKQQPQQQQEGEGEREKRLNGKMEKMELDGNLATKEFPTPPSIRNTANGHSDSGAAAAAAASEGSGKKRNRQKERLARRAAEQEAAALRAEQEAATMTDHRAIEKTYMLAAFQKNGLEEVEIQPDGHCLFSAVADQLLQLGIPLLVGGATGEGRKGGAGGAGENDTDSVGKAEKKEKEEAEPGYKIVRRQAAGYLLAHGDQYAGFLDEDLPGYVRKIRDTAEWGGQLELSALANVYGVEICVVQERDTEVIGPTNHDQEEGKGGSGGGGEMEEGRERKRIWLAYYRHGYGLGEHYNSLRRKS